MNELCGPHVVIVLGVREGRGFEFLTQPMWIEASLKGHRIESDAVDPCPMPSICTELVWETEKKEVRKLRSSHVPLRLDCYTLDMRQQREKLGFILLSLRSAAAITGDFAGELEPHWHRLVSVPNEYRLHKPELSLTLTIRNRICTPNNVVEVEQTMEIPQTPQAPTVIPIIYLEEGYIQIGNNCPFNEKFILSFFIKVAHNLDTILNEDMVFAPHSEKFFLTLSILGITINTKYFGKNMHDPIVLNERIVFKLLTNLEVFQMFLEEFKTVPLHFHHGQKVIATAKINLRSFLNNNQMDFERPCKLEQCAEFVPKEELVKSNKIICNRIACAYVETLLEKQPPKPKSTPETPAKNPVQCPSDEATVGSDESVGDHRNACGDQAKIKNRKEAKGLSPRFDIPTEDAGCQTTFRESPHIMTRSASLKKKNTKEPTIPALCWTHETGTYILYKLDIVFKSITWRKKLNLQAFQFKFHHPKAQQALVINCDVDEIFLSEVMVLENVCCIMHFLSTPESIRNIIAMYPPSVSLQNCEDKNIADDFTLYTKILQKDELDSCEYFAVLNILGSIDEVLCDLQIEMKMEPISDKENMKYDESEFNLEPVVIDDWLAVKTVKDLEEWKEKQEILFKDKLKLAECTRLEQLQNEWNIKRSELESKLQKGMEKCKLLSFELNHSAEELRFKKRELDRKLLSSPQSREKIEIKVTEMLEEEMNKNIERIQAEKDKLMEKIDYLREEKKTLEENIQKRMAELEEIRKSTLTTEQTANLLLEIRQLEEKFQQAQMEKAFFKQQWHSTLKELHILKAEDQRQIRQEIQRHKEELSQLNLDDSSLSDIASPEVSKEPSEESLREEEERLSLNFRESFEKLEGMMETLHIGNLDFETGDSEEDVGNFNISLSSLDNFGSGMLEKIEEGEEVDTE